MFLAVTLSFKLSWKNNAIRTGASGGGGGGVNLAGKEKNLFLVTIDVYRLENRKIEVCRVSGGGETHRGLGAPGSGKFHK